MRRVEKLNQCRLLSNAFDTSPIPIGGGVQVAQI